MFNRLRAHRHAQKFYELRTAGGTGPFDLNRELDAAYHGARAMELAPDRASPRLRADIDESMQQTFDCLVAMAAAAEKRLDAYRPKPRRP